MAAPTDSVVTTRYPLGVSVLLISSRLTGESSTTSTSAPLCTCFWSATSVGLGIAGTVAARFSLQEGFHFFHKRFGVNRFGNVAVESRRERLVATTASEVSSSSSVDKSVRRSSRVSLDGISFSLGG